MISHRDVFKTKLDGLILNPSVDILNAQNRNPNALAIKFSLDYDADINSPESQEIKKAIRKRIIGNKEYDEVNADIKMTGKDILRGVRDLFIDLCAEMEDSDLEDVVIKERVKNATNKKR